MTSNDVFLLVLRWMHIFGAIAAVGGMIYIRFALMPSLSELAEDQRTKLQAALRARWSKAVMICITLILVSGLINTVRTATLYDFPGGLYHPILGVKILLAFVVFGISSLLVGRSAMAQRIKRRGAFWLTLNLVLAVITVAAASWLRQMERVPKADGATQIETPDMQPSEER